MMSFAEEIPTEEVSGVVRIVRSQPETEIFFVDRKESVIVPAGAPDHNKVLKMSLDSIKSKKSVSMSIDPVSRRFIALPGSSKKSVTSIDEAPELVQVAPSKAKSSSFKDIPEDSSK